MNAPASQSAESAEIELCLRFENRENSLADIASAERIKALAHLAKICQKSKDLRFVDIGNRLVAWCSGEYESLDAALGGWRVYGFFSPAPITPRTYRRE